MEKPLVQNAADPEQVKEAKELTELREGNEVNDLRAVLETRAGRNVFWRLLQHCGVFKTVFDSHGSRMSYNAGVQDTGHYIMAEVMKASPDYYLKMQEESNKEKKI